MMRSVTSVSKWLGIIGVCLVLLASNAMSSDVEPGEELDDFEFDEDGEYWWY